MPQGTEVVAVFEERERAREAAEALRQVGVPPGDVRVAAGDDHLTAMRGEMQEEMEKTVAGPGSIGPFTRGMQRGLGLGLLAAIPPGVVLGAVIGAVMVLWFGDISWWVGALVGAGVGGVAGATVGFMAGGLYPGVMGEDAVLGAERGITVGVSTADPELARHAARALHEAGALRVDTMGADGRIVEHLEPRDAIRSEGGISEAYEEAEHERRRPH